MKPFSAALLCLFAACANPSGAYDPDEMRYRRGRLASERGRRFRG